MKEDYVVFSDGVEGLEQDSNFLTEERAKEYCVGQKKDLYIFKLVKYIKHKRRFKMQQLEK
jgi:hypothetical protein